jgi:hypothetical protein
VPTEPEYDADDSPEYVAEPADAADDAEKGDAAGPEPDDGPDGSPADGSPADDDPPDDDSGGPEAADAGASPQTVQ